MISAECGCEYAGQDTRGRRDVDIYLRPSARSAAGLTGFGDGAETTGALVPVVDTNQSAT